MRLTDGYVAAVPQLRDAIREFLREEESGAADPRWHDLTHRVCLDLFDQDAYNYLAARQVERLRAEGALTVLPVALVTLAGALVFLFAAVQGWQGKFWEQDSRREPPVPPGSGGPFFWPQSACSAR